MLRISVLLVIFLSGPVGSAVAGAAVTVVRHLKGYECMAVRLTPAEMMNPSAMVPIFSAPSSASPKLGIAGVVVAVRDPPVNRNEFTEVLFPSGVLGWVETAQLKPWVAAPGTNGECHPALLSNGRIGFDYVQ